MLNEDSVLKSFYPVEFVTDLNGKQQEWESVVLIPSLMRWGGGKGREGKQEWEAVVLVPFIDDHTHTHTHTHTHKHTCMSSATFSMVAI